MIFDLTNLLSKILIVLLSVRFLLFNILYSVFNEHSLNFFVKLYSYLITNQIPVKPNDLSPTSLDRK